MVSKKILEEHGCTQARLREVFTAKKGNDHEIRERFQDLLQSRILEGIQFSARNSKLYMAVDAAWDSLPINKSTIPLLQYAQNKISIEQCSERLESLGTADQFCDYDDEGNLKKIDSLRSCVIRIPVKGSSCLNLCITCHKSSLVNASRAPNGSSKIKTSGL